MRAVHALFAVLAAVATMVAVVAVVAIKRGVEWSLQGASDTTLNVLLVVVLGPALITGAWLWLLQPLIQRRKQRQQAGGGEGAQGAGRRD